MKPRVLGNNSKVVEPVWSLEASLSPKERLDEVVRILAQGALNLLKKEAEDKKAGRTKESEVEESSPSKNSISLAQLSLACRHVEEMREVGITENFAIRLLELFADSYARQNSGGKNVFAPLHAKDITLWSTKAKAIQKNGLRGKHGQYVRVEHGTPRRAFARMVLKLYKKGNLDEKRMKDLVSRYWEVAVITLEEDARLNKVARSKMYDTPRERWAAAGIKF